MGSQPNRANRVGGKNWFDSDDELAEIDDGKSTKMSESTITAGDEEGAAFPLKEGHTTPQFVVNVTRQVVVETSPR